MLKFLLGEILFHHVGFVILYGLLKSSFESCDKKKVQKLTCTCVMCRVRSLKQFFRPQYLHERSGEGGVFPWGAMCSWDDDA